MTEQEKAELARLTELAKASTDSTSTESETFEFLNPKTRIKYALPKKIGDVELKSLIEDVIGHSRGERRREYDNKINELTAQLSELEPIKSEYEQIRANGLSEKEKIDREIKRRDEEIKKRDEKEKKLFAELQNEKLRNAINNEIQKRTDLVNVADTVDLFNAQCRPRLIQSGESWQAVAELDGSDLSIPEAINKWLSRPEKANLLKINLTPGGGSTGGSKAVNGQKTIKRSQYDTLSLAERGSILSSGVSIVD